MQIIYFEQTNITNALTASNKLDTLLQLSFNNKYGKELFQEMNL